MARAGARRRMAAWGVVSVVLVDDGGIGRINRACFGRSGATDVISLTYAPVPGETDGGAAEIIVNVQRAQEEGGRHWRQADRAGCSPRPPRRRVAACLELALYLAHGCDHLTGATDDTPVLRRRMRQRELRWVRDAQRLDLLRGLLPPPRRTGLRAP
jgi:ssRNA-specific RNase YbeY (16S rRNA maturation enzyme)